ncbi:hypothetical protein [Paenibacillus soyae]|uniref:TolB protein n=1 Tax=Paenibacillus soyae TaxID=2969249 RepID=A0A9X2SA56_9BACL|nr:hypothetical protein [Paenibacillus soyae]MCR2805745.1 hypothetical protein [Paenibacillus soyae]
MNRSKMKLIACVPVLLIGLAACSSDNTGDRTVIKEPGKTITVIDDAGKETSEPVVEVERIESLVQLELYGWLDEERVIVSRENESLAKMKLEELADSHPRSLYVYDLLTDDYEPLKEQDNAFLGGAALSPDKKHLIYQEYTLGDPVFHVMNLETRATFGLHGEPIGGAISAKWADDGTVIGASYAGGAYAASVTGEIDTIAGLEDDGALFLVEPTKDMIYYNTNSDSALMAFNRATKETASLGFDQAYDIVPSPDGTHLLVLQQNGSRKTLTLCDADGGSRKTIAEGTELGGISWSPDQRMIAYSMKGDANGTAIQGLQLYDLLTGETTPIAVDVEIESVSTHWNASGEKLAYTEWDGEQTSSHIVSLKYSLR